MHRPSCRAASLLHHRWRTDIFIIAVLFLCAVPGFVLARLSVAAPVILAAVLFAIPADEARADSGHPGGNYPLHCAAGVDNNLAAVIHLLGSAHGKNVNERDADSGRYPYSCSSRSQYGRRDTPLHQAASHGHATIAATLIVAGADVNATTNYGDAPLHDAARSGHAPIISILIAAGADVNAKRVNGWTPLYQAYYWLEFSAVPILIAAGGHWGETCANPAVVNPARPSPPCLSVESCGGLTPPKHYDATAGECVPLAACRYEEVRNEETNTCECHAPNVRADYGRCRAPSSLSADICARTSPPQFYSPTLSACTSYDECMASEDCALNATSCARGFSPNRFYDSTAGECVPFAECDDTANLNRATNECECSKSQYLEYLRPSGVCESSCEAAEVPVRQGSAKKYPGSIFYYNHYKCECPTTTATDVNGVCEFLYPCHDSAIRKADNSGCECPAGTFAHGDPSGGARYSNRSGGRYYNKNDYGQYEYIPDTAECHSAPDENHTPWTHDLEWTTAITLDGPEVVSHFIADHGRDPDANHDLYYAAEHGYYQAAKALIEGGANPDRKNGDAGTPLHPAVRNERAELITLLIDRGADVNIVADDDGETPLHLAARRADTPENAALVSFLLDKGADPNIFNDRRWRPLDLADGRDGYPRRRKIMSALIAGGANWSDECVGGKVPNEFTPPKCKCPARLSIDNNGLCECPGHSHSQVNGLCLPKDSAQVEGEIAKMQVELARLRAALVSLNARLSLSAEMPRETVEGIAEQARETAAEIDWRRANFVALGRRAEAGEAPPPVALSDTAAECRMRGGEVRIDSGSGTRICLGLDQSGTFCLVDSGDAFPCRGLFKHVRRCNDVYHRPALNAFICGERCGADETARGKGCE